MTYAEKKAETERLTALLPAVREELMRIPGVSRVAVGIRERGGKLTEEFVFRVHVGAKVAETALSPAQIIPKTIRGVATDVVIKRMPVPEVGFNDENDNSNYDMKVGGISIGAEVAGGTGTLGCFCQRTTDDRIVFLSNWHVMIDPGGAIGDGIGQPNWRKSCCCTTGKIGEVLDFDEDLDAAIAELDEGVPFAPKIRRIERDDGTVEEGGSILGGAAPVAGDEVWKIGKRTGLTRGIISDVDADRIEVSPNAPFTRMSNKGDSGSVYVSLATGMVCALHHSGNGTEGFGTPFDVVMTGLNIEVMITDPDAEYNVLEWPEPRRKPRVQPPFVEVTREMESTPAGCELLRLFETHREECLELVEQHRRVTAAWHRSHGPAYLAALARSAREPAYRIPAELNGVSRGDAARRVADAIRAEASPPLLADLDAMGPALIDVLARADTVREILQAWEEARSPVR